MTKRHRVRSLESLGFRVWEGRPRPMEVYHRHDDIEINCIHQGSITYLFGPALTTLHAGSYVLFWAALPHLLLKCDPDTRMSWVTLPLSRALQWELPQSFTRRLMDGQMVIDRTDPIDPAMLQRWTADLAADEAARRDIVALELEARLRRAALIRARQAADSHRRTAVHAGKVERMAGYIARRYTDPIAVVDIARHVGLHPNYAMTLFRQTCGLSLVDYITRHRVSHAQRLLATTNRSILEVALNAGFGSLSRFYEAFARACACTPRQYRVQLRGSV